MKLHTCFSALLLALSLSLSPAVDAATYTTERYFVEGLANARLTDINNIGEMVGAAVVGDVGRAFVIDRFGSVSMLSAPTGALDSFASGIADSGLIVGGYIDNSIDSSSMGFPLIRGLIWDGDRFDVISIDGVPQILPSGISANGRYVTGTTGGSSAFGSWLLDRASGSYSLLPLGTSASDVSNDGTVVGVRRWRDSPRGPLISSAFTFKDGEMSLFQLSGLVGAQPRAINEYGLMVGYVGASGAGASVFIGNDPEYSIGNWKGWNTFVDGVNEQGVAVGWARAAGSDQEEALVFRPIPEPGTMALAFTGFALLGFTRKRRH